MPILFKALLLAQLPLFDHGPITSGVLTHTHDQPQGVVIGVNPTLGVSDSVTLFMQVMAVILGEFWNYEYTINGPKLTLWPHGSTVPITLPTPDLKWHPDGVQIRHWTSADLHRFYQATACWPGIYQEPPESNDPEQDPIAARLAKRHRNQTADADPPYTPVRHSFTKFLRITRFCAIFRAVYEISGLETVLRQSILSEADIDQLYSYRDQLTNDQVVDVLFRMNQRVSQDTVQRWYSLLGDKHQQTLKTNPPWLDGSDQTMEAMHDVEDILKDLLPGALLSMP